MLLNMYTHILHVCTWTVDKANLFYEQTVKNHSSLFIIHLF